MATSTQNTSSQAIVNEYAQQGKHHVARVSYLFVIHFSEKMFADNVNEDVYFHQCLQTYINILKQKLSHNKDDYMGLMFCNTTESDEGVENIFTVQKLKTCTTNMYTEIMKLYDNDMKYYRDRISTTNCLISDVLLHAIRTYDTVTAKAVRNVILLTCDDHPAIDDSTERHRIRLNAKNYKDNNIKLNIIGLGDDWDYNIFYKEIEMLAENTAGRNFKRTNLKDLEEDVIYKSHIMTYLDLRIQNSAKIKVSLQGFITRRRYLKTNTMGKDTNEPLDVHSWFSFVEDGEDANDDDEPRFQDNVPEDVKKKQNYGGRNIIFTSGEVRSLRFFTSAGIDIIGFKPMPENEPIYQIQPVLFIGCHRESSNGELKFFTTLLSKMIERNLMAICSLSLRLNFRTRLYMMWPSRELGGFYLYRMPFKEDVRSNLLNLAGKYKFNQDDNPPPVSMQQVDVMKCIVETLCVENYPIGFSNSREERLVKSVEAVALELPPVEETPDNTLPNFELMKNKLNELELLQLYNDSFDEVQETAKTQGSKIRRLDDEYVNNIMREGNFNKLTAVALKSVLRTLGQSTTGNKAELIEKLNDYKAKNFP